jgi:tetratricopeptide (TPR) repeat protein
LKPDQYVITVRVPGYVEERETVELQTTSSQYLQFRLKADGSGGGSGRASAPAATVDANVPPAAQKEFEKGEAALAEAKKESPEQAALHYQKALVIYPRFVQAQLKLGTVYMDLQQWDKAEQALRKTIELEPKTANAFFALGQLYLHQKKFDQAEKALTDGLAIETRSAQAHLTLALVYWDKVAGVKDEKQWRPLLEKSYEEVKQALTIDANLAAAHLLKGNLLFKVQRASDAMTEYQEYLRLDPSGQFAAQTRALVEKIKKALAGQKP